MVNSDSFEGFFFSVIVICGLGLIGYAIDYRIKKIRKKKSNSINHLPVSNLEPFPNSNEQINIEDQDAFIKDIVNRYSSYQEFITSKEFDEYFIYLHNNPKVLYDIKDKIEQKQNSSFFKYKITKY